MSLTYPLAPADLIDLLRIETAKPMLAWQQQRSLSGGGETLYADRSPPLWQWDLGTVVMPNAEASAAMALINSLGGGLRRFLMYPIPGAYPQADPDGSIFGSATPVVGTITDRLHVAFTGFPNDYVLKRGDFISILFGTTRRYLGQLVEDRTADGSGAVASVTVAPALPESVAPGDAVNVVKPLGKFTVVPGSAYPSTTGPLHSRISLSVEQSYGA